MGRGLVSVSFGYKKGKFSRTYDVYVRLGDLLDAKHILDKAFPGRNYFGSDHPGDPDSRLVRGCLVELHPHTTYRGSSTRWEYERPDQIKFTTEGENVSRLRGLLRILKLPSKVELK